MEDFTEKQKEAIRQFRGRLEDLPHKEYDDYSMLKWLKARNMDAKKAESMFRTSIEYKKTMKVDTLLGEFKPPQVLKDYLTGGFCGYDKEGSPIRVELFGRLDMRGLMCSCKKSDLEKTKLVQCEYIINCWKEQSRKLGKRVDGLIVIFDMENVGTKSLWRPGLDMYLYLVKVLEDNYPEMMKRMYVINAPVIFPVLWKICRPLISEDMKNKIKVLGGDFKEQMLKDIDAEQLPACYGGTQVDVDGDARCPSKICQGGEVPRQFYLSENLDETKMESSMVVQGKKLQIDFEVEKPGAILRWEFRTEDYDIGFGVQRVTEDSKPVDVVPIKRFNCHQVAHDGSIICEEKGTYGVVFDNSYSWSKDKRLYYTVELLPSPDSNTQEEVDAVTDGGSWLKLTEEREMVQQ